MSIYINENKCPKDGCVQKKSNGKWGVISGKTGKFWDADYDSESDAKEGLKGYFANENIITMPSIVENIVKTLNESIEIKQLEENLIKTFDKYLDAISNQIINNRLRNPDNSVLADTELEINEEFNHIMSILNARIVNYTQNILPNKIK